MTLVLVGREPQQFASCGDALINMAASSAPAKVMRPA
jgi:hypothetical protein